MPTEQPSTGRQPGDSLAGARIAIVHDYLNQLGGAERVLEVLHEIFPAAPIYTSLYDPALVSLAFGHMEVHTSFMQRLPFATRHHQAFLPFYPAAFEQFDLSGYDVVLSMSSAWSKGVVTQPETCHVCYCLAPMRFAWQAHAYAAQERIPRWAGWLLPHVLTWLRTWDVTTAQRVDAFVAISRAVAGADQQVLPAVGHHHPPARGYPPLCPGRQPRRLLPRRLAPRPLQAH